MLQIVLVLRGLFSYSTERSNVKCRNKALNMFVCRQFIKGNKLDHYTQVLILYSSLAFHSDFCDGFSSLTLSYTDNIFCAKLTSLNICVHVINDDDTPLS